MPEISFTGIKSNTRKALSPQNYANGGFVLLLVCTLLIYAAQHIMVNSYLTLNIVAEI